MNQQKIAKNLLYLSGISEKRLRALYLYKKKLLASQTYNTIHQKYYWFQMLLVSNSHFKGFADQFKFIRIPCQLPSFVLFANIFFFSCLNAQAEENYSATDDLSLFGIAIHQEQRNDIYIGALYAPSNVKTTKQLIDPSIRKKMSLKFLAKYSERKMARFWKQRIALNNSKSNWQPMTKSILQFGKLFKRSMQVGDELSLQFAPSKGTSIFLNGTHFLTIKDVRFYKLLLNVWIGNIPPTKAFKTGITGKNKTETTEKLIQQYASIQMESGRFDADKPQPEKVAANTKKQDNKKATRKPVANIKKTNPKQKSKIEAPPKQQPSVATNKNKSTRVKQDPDAKKSIANSPAKSTNNLPIPANIPLTPPTTEVEVVKPELILDIPTGEKNTPSDNKQKENALSESTDESLDTKKEQVAKLELPEEKQFDSDLYTGTYTRKLINAIRKVQRYPKRAVDQGIEGDVVILIKIDKNGEVIERRLTQRSGSRIIDRAVLKMVNKAEPFPTIPEELGVEEFEFSVPLSFAFTD